FGDDTMKILLNEPEKVREIKHRGLEKEMDKLLSFVNDVNKDVEKNREIFKMREYLVSIGIIPKYHDKILSIYELDKAKLIDDIYGLYTKCDVPFKICDTAALKNGYGKNCYERLENFIKMIFKKFIKDGKLYVEKVDIEQKMMEFEGIKLKKILDMLVSANDYLETQKIYYTTHKIYEMEQYIEKTCNKMVIDNPPINIPYKHNEEGFYKDPLNEKALDLDPSQSRAIEMVLKNKISIINGGAGTGKTFVVAMV